MDEKKLQELLASIDVPSDLLGSVLSKTSGSVCGRALELMASGWDGPVGQVDDDLLRGHREHCAACRAVEPVLAALRNDLPGLAELDPGPLFTREVVAATSLRPSLGERIRVRAHDIWRDMARRPRIAWETAYVGLVTCLLLFGLPFSPMADVPGRALDMVRANPVQEQVVALEGQVTAGLQIAWSSGQAQAQSVLHEMDRRVGVTEPAREGIRIHGRDLVDRVKVGDLQGGAAAIGGLGRGVGSFMGGLVTGTGQESGIESQEAGGE